MDGNNQLLIGKRYDTGRKYIDPATDKGHVIYRKALAIAVALPNAGNIDVAHGEDDIDLTKPVKVTELTGYDAVTPAVLAGAASTFVVDDTNVNIATALDLSGYTTGLIEIEFCLTTTEY